jgi:hypothetical protein
VGRERLEELGDEPHEVGDGRHFDRCQEGRVSSSSQLERCQQTGPKREPRESLAAEELQATCEAGGEGEGDQGPFKERETLFPLA